MQSQLRAVLRLTTRLTPQPTKTAFCRSHPSPRSLASLQSESRNPPPARARAIAAMASSRVPSRVAVGQMTSVGAHDINYQTCTKLAQEAVSAGCSMLFLPECFAFMGMSQAESLSKAESLDGPLLARYKELAGSNKLWLSLGGFQETGPDEAHMYNTHVILSSEGELVKAYRKVHLFDVDVPNGPILMESRGTAPGRELAVCDTPAGSVGMGICYDIRFPEMSNRLTWEMGATVLTYPSAFTVATGKAHWEILLRARAIECQAYVVAAAQAGKHNDKRESYGHAMIVDPWGTVVARLDDPLATGIAVADLDMAKMDSVRGRMPIHLHRRAGLKSLGLKSTFMTE